MPVKRTTRAKVQAPKPTAWQRYLPRAQRHPIIALSTIALLVGMLVSLGPTIVWAIHYYETEEAARQTEAALRALIQQNRLSEDRNLAWSSVQAIKTEITVSRNRVNDCDIAQQRNRIPTPLEMSTCAQYRADLADATHRFEDARRIALDLSKGATQ